MTRRERLAETARRNRMEIVAAGLSRREMLALGLLGGSGYLVAKGGVSAWASPGPDGGFKSPATTPFLEELPIAPVLSTSSLSPAPGEAPVAGEAPRASHQRFGEFPPQKTYELTVRPALHSFHPELPPSTIWGYNGSFPGPTIKARYGEPVVVRFRNELPALAQHSGFGRPEITTHLHNGHTASESDGFAGDFYATGLFKDNHYPNVHAGFSGSFAPNGDPRETLATLWYHDHRFDFTAQNVYRGLVGFYLLYNELDSGDETNPGGFGLPSGRYDIPLIFADKVFDSAGQVYYDLFNLDGILGDKFTVNGKIQPRFRVARRKYRFRLLDGGPSRFYEFFLSSGQPFVQISEDGNLLPAPLARKSIRLGVAERVDVVLDFTQAPSTVYLENRLEQKSGRGPTGKILPAGQGDLVLRFDVEGGPVPDPSRIPARFYELPPADPAEAVTTRSWRFERTNGAWAINGKFFDVNEVRAAPRQGTAEIWVLKASGNWWHPIHIHFEEFQILSRNGRRPPANEIARKDVVKLSPNEEVRLFIRFRDFHGRHVMHCHNTVHEDHAMMLRWDIVP